MTASSLPVHTKCDCFAGTTLMPPALTISPFAGAIVVADIILAGHRPCEAIAKTLQFVHFLADDETITIG